MTATPMPVCSPVGTFWRWDIVGPAVWCCGRWHPIPQIPFRVVCCGRVYFAEESPHEHARVDGSRS